LVILKRCLNNTYYLVLSGGLSSLNECTYSCHTYALRVRHLQFLSVSISQSWQSFRICGLLELEKKHNTIVYFFSITLVSILKRCFKCLLFSVKWRFKLLCEFTYSYNMFYTQDISIFGSFLFHKVDKVFRNLSSSYWTWKRHNTGLLFNNTNYKS
jgi:hypothetical protein